MHVSLSFMFTPTLASSLYLLLLRFLYRDYNEVFRLVNTIGTDTEFSPEENYIFQLLGSANNGDRRLLHVSSICGLIRMWCVLCYQIVTRTRTRVA